MADTKKPTLEEDKVLAPSGRIRLEDGSIQKVGMQEAYAEIDKRQNEGFYLRVQYLGSDGEEPTAEEIKEEAKPEDKPVDPTPDTPKGEPKNDAKFERGNVVAFRVKQHRPKRDKEPIPAKPAAN